MSLALRAINRLRRQYQMVLSHMRELNSSLFSPSGSVLLLKHPCTIEPLEGRLLLSGTHYVVDSLGDDIANDGVLTLREAILASNAAPVRIPVPGPIPGPIPIPVPIPFPVIPIILPDIIPIYPDLPPILPVIPTGSDTETDIITFDQAALSAEAGVAIGEALTITLGGEQLTINGNLEIIGLGSDILTIDANSQSRVMEIDDCEVSLSGLTLTGGSLTSGDGGGICNNCGTVTLTDSVVSGNLIGTGRGGGIYNRSGDLTLINSRISDNHITGGIAFGGGIYSYAGTVTLSDNSVVSDNSVSSGRGGGIENADGPLTLIDSTVSGNSVLQGEGGGIFNYGGSVTLTGSAVSANLVYDGDGGGIFSHAGTITLTDSIVFANSADPDNVGAGRGGGIYSNYDNSMTLILSTVSDNTSSDNGGGIYHNHGSDLTLIVSTVSGNTSSGRGGGIYSDYESTLTLTASTVSGNSAMSGGGIYSNYNLEVTIEYSTVSGNTAISGNGGGIYNGGELTITDSTVSDNTAVSGPAFYSGRGGGIYSNGIMVIEDSMICGNTASSGGGISGSGGTTFISYSTISGNDALSGDGGGIYVGGEVILINSVLSGNSASANGGGIFSDHSSYAMLVNSTVSANSALMGGGIYCEDYGIPMLDDTLILNNSIVALNHVINSTLQCSDDIMGGCASNNSLIGIDPGFVRKPSAGTDGLWGTDDDDYGDLRLGNTSVAINFGDDSLAVDRDGTELIYDISGNPRTASSHVDIGAYEYQGSLSFVRELSSVVTTLDDVVDSTDGLISLREALVYSDLLDRDVTFSSKLAGGTITLSGRELYIYQSVVMDATSIGGLTIDADSQSRVMYITADDVYLTGLALTGGLTANAGGGIYHFSGALTLTNSIISGNTSYYSGGGIFDMSGTTTLTNSTVSGNAVTYEYSSGGGIVSSDFGSLILNNSIVALNYDTKFTDITGEYISDNSLIGVDPGFVRNPSAGVDGVWGTSDDDAGDLRLADTSLAIDIGDNLLATGDDGLALAVDLDGNTRIVGDSVDIGAYEYQDSDSVLRESRSSIVTTLNDVVNSTDGLISLREALVYADLLGTDVTFDSALAGGTITLSGQQLYIYQSVNVDAASIGGMTIDADGQSRVMYIDGCEVSLIGLRIVGGSSLGGGGIYNYYGDLTLTNSIVTGNMAVDGGGIFNDDSTLTLTNSTVAGNVATSLSGGIFGYSAVTMNNSILSMNEAPEEIGIFWGWTFNNSLVDIDPGFVRNPSAGTDGVWGTDDDDYGDLRLADTSVAIGCGDNSLSVDGNGMALAVDFSGNPRIAGERVDIGACEYQGSPSDLRELSPIVTTLADVVDSTDGLVSLREALVYGSLLGEDVTFDSTLAGGTITLGGQELSVYQSVAVDATSIGGMSIDADMQSRVMYIHSGEVSLTALTLTGGSTSESGGGIYNHGGTVSLVNSIVSGNSAHSGGGISNYKGTLRLTNSTVSDNLAEHAGGGINNSQDGYVVLTGSTVSGNSADWSGGGIENGGDMLLKNSVVSGNSSQQDSGGINNWRGDLMLTNSTISGNTAVGGGAGITNEYGILTLTNSVVAGNAAGVRGGGIQSYNGTLILTNSTVAGNSADYSGGIYSSSDMAVILNNSIVALNEAESDSDIKGLYISNNSLLGTDPGFVRNPSAGDDGEWGTDDDDYGDLRLRPDSAAIDAGDNALAVDANGVPLATDIRGVDRNFGESVDIGAYEYQDMAGDANGDEIVDIEDFIILKQNYGLAAGATKADGNFNSDEGINLDDFIILKQNYSTSQLSTPATPPAITPVITPATLADRIETIRRAWPEIADTIAAISVKPALDPIDQLDWTPPLETLQANNFEILDIIAAQ